MTLRDAAFIERMITGGRTVTIDRMSAEEFEARATEDVENDEYEAYMQAQRGEW